MEWSASCHSSSSACLQLLVPRAEEKEDEEEDHTLWPADCMECQCLLSVHIALIICELLVCNLVEACNILSA